MAIYTKKTEDPVTVDVNGVIDSGQTLTNCEGITFGALIYDLTGGSPEVDMTLEDADGRDVLNGQGIGIREDKTMITFDDIGGTLVFNETLTIKGTANENFKFDLFLMK